MKYKVLREFSIPNPPAQEKFTEFNEGAGGHLGFICIPVKAGPSIHQEPSHTSHTTDGDME